MFFGKKQEKDTKKENFKTFLVGSYYLTANSDHSLEYFLRDNKHYSLNLPRIARLIESKYPEYAIVDVGANIGDTIALLKSANVNQKVYCVEGDPAYFDILQKNVEQFKGVEIFKVFLGEETKKENFQIDISNGTARLKIDAESKVEILSLNDLAKNNSFQDVRFVKIDTDGFDLKVLRGGFDFFSQTRAVLFFEYDVTFLELQNEDPLSIFPQLLRLGYNQGLFYDNYGKLLMPVNLAQTDPLEHLHRYIRNKDGGFEYFDVCVFHQQDDDLVSYIIEEEKKYFS